MISCISATAENLLLADPADEWSMRVIYIQVDKLGNIMNNISTATNNINVPSVIPQVDNISNSN